MNVLLVEDDEFKAADIARLLNEGLPASTLERAASVTSALRMITAGAYDLVVLDMSLPTFDLSGPGGGGSPQGQGGVEVLRLANRLGVKATYVVVTQYPDIEIDGQEIPLSEAAAKLTARFKLKVAECVPYEFDGNDWEQDLREFLSQFNSTTRLAAGPL
jgi:CheY-like chemotaxis protein